MNHCKNHPDQQALLIALLLMLPMILQMTGSILDINPPMPPWIQLIIATIVQFWCARHILHGAFYSLMNFSANMDLLISLATLTTYVTSVVSYITATPESIYFETNVAIITLVLLGRWLEDRSHRQAQSAREKLIHLQPKKALVERREERFTLPSEEIALDDILFIRPGDTIAADGKVIEGTSFVDESLLTGESRPVLKKAGSTVYAGSINHEGILRVCVEHVGQSTLLSSIIEMLKNIQITKIPLQRLADRILEVFVPVVVLVSFGVILFWLHQGLSLPTSLMYGVAVLIISSPCALALATPTVISIAGGLAAEKGILFQESNAIERIGKINIILFDKTGTLTEGLLKIVEITPYERLKEKEILILAAALAHDSSHPISQTILKEARQRNLPIEPVTDYQEFPGKGLSATKRGDHYFLGSLLMAQQHGLTINLPNLEHLQEEGKTISILWTGNRLLGSFALSDTPRPEAKQMISRFKKKGIKTSMLSGDNQKTAGALARYLEIDDYEAEVLPAEKVKRIATLRSQGFVVAMVGDGINDAPALAAADTGIAIHNGRNISIAASDLTFTSSNILSIYDAYDLSKKALRKIRQNLFFAFFYNLVAIPFAAAGEISPIVAATAMSLSSLCVITNALLLRRWKR